MRIQNQYYQEVLGATGGAWPYTWAITAGALPAGLTLSFGRGHQRCGHRVRHVHIHRGGDRFVESRPNGNAKLTLNIPPVTSVLLPSAGATLQGSTTYFDASASSQNAMSRVQFEISGGSISDEVIGTGTLTALRLARPGEHDHSSQRHLHAAERGLRRSRARAGTSAPITITVNNAPPTTSVLLPSNGATQSGGTATLDASRIGERDLGQLRAQRRRLERPGHRRGQADRSTAGSDSGTRPRSPTAPTRCKAWPPTRAARVAPARPSRSR
jgi:hypothetical protein